MDLFVFGTLLHLPLLEVVSGDAEVASKIRWAVRPGFRVSRVSGQVFPMLHEDADGVAEGIIISGLSEEALERLDYYERAFGYDRLPFAVLDENQMSRNVTVYLPEPGRWEPAETWDREGWIAAYGEVTVMTAQEAMASMGQMPAEEMGARYGQMMARAASRHRAQSDTGHGRMGRGDVQLIQARQRYAGFFNVEELDLAFRRRT